MAYVNLPPLTPLRYERAETMWVIDGTPQIAPCYGERRYLTDCRRFEVLAERDSSYYDPGVWRVRGLGLWQTWLASVDGPWCGATRRHHALDALWSALSTAGLLHATCPTTRVAVS